MEKQVDVAIIGAGTAGLFALAEVRKATDSFVLINGGELGTTCARVGCMPSKAAIQVADDFHRRILFDRYGMEGTEALNLDIAEAMEHVRDLRDIFVDRVLSGSTDEMGEEFIEGYARFLEPDLLEVADQRIRAKRVVIATGSRPIVPAAWEGFREQVLTTDEVFEQQTLPDSVAVVGLGAIGVELGQALHRMGVQVTGIDRLERIGGLQDPTVSEVAAELLGKEFPLWLGREVSVESRDGRLQVRAGDKTTQVEKVLASLGRTPNLERLDMDRLGVACDERGVPEYDRETMQVGDFPIFIAGDVTGDRAILHEAGNEGRIAGYNAVQDTPVRFRRKTPMAITFCDPNLAAVGTPFDELDAETTATGEIRFGPVGRALIMGKNKGILRLYADRKKGTLLGAELAAPRGENLAHLIAWSIEQGLSVGDLVRMPYYHPTIEEALQAAADDLRRQLNLPADGLKELARKT